MMGVNSCDVFKFYLASQIVLHCLKITPLNHAHTLIFSTSAPVLTLRLPAHHDIPLNVTTYSVTGDNPHQQSLL
jgi:hypothetical protein